MKVFRATEEQKEYINKHYKNRSTKELTIMFNEHFKNCIKESQLRGYKQRNKLRSGFDSCFKKGQEPHNKGKKGINGCSSTSFKKGNIPFNKRSVGSERIDKDGYALIKTKDPNTWELKHRVIWEKQNGKVPEGYAVIFGNGNKKDLRIENLILVSRRQLILMNRKKMILEDIELTKTNINICNLQMKVNDLRKRKKKLKK